MVTLSLASGSAGKGTQITLALSISSSGGNQCTGVQWSFGFSADLTLISIVPGPAAANKVMNLSGPQVIIGGFDANVIPNGVLVYATFAVSSTTTATSLTVLLEGIVASDVSGHALTASTSPGTITVLIPLKRHGGGGHHIKNLFLNSATGQITGNPVDVGTFDYQVQVTDSLGNTSDVICTINITGGLTRGMSILTAKQWATIREKGLLGLPTDIYFDHDYPNAGFHLWPIPDLDYGIEFFYWAVLTSFASVGSSENLPQGYYDLLVYELAIRLCQVYRRQVPPSVQALAKNARKSVIDLNAQIIDGSFQYTRTLDGPSTGEVKPKALGPPEPRLLPGARDPGEGASR